MNRVTNEEAARSIARREALAARDDRPDVDGDADGSEGDGAEGTAPPKKTNKAEHPKGGISPSQKLFHEADKRIRGAKGYASAGDGKTGAKLATCEAQHGPAKKSKGNPYA